MEVSEGFAAVARPDARILILGSLPGERSIAEQEYYAHPRNAFWPIMKVLYGVDGSYKERCEQIQDNGVAVWDVLQASVRSGSLDADIQVNTARVNDFGAFLSTYSNINLIVFNGKKAEQLFKRRVANSIIENVRLAGLPSTSPAYAAMKFSTKLEIWRAALKR